MSKEFHPIVQMKEDDEARDNPGKLSVYKDFLIGTAIAERSPGNKDLDNWPNGYRKWRFLLNLDRNIELC